ncbi:MAG: hypothetical protein ACRC1M_04155 [Methanobacteriaceae archaeon]
MHKNKIKIFILILVAVIGISTFYYFSFVHIDNEEFYNVSENLRFGVVFSTIGDLYKGESHDLYSEDRYNYFKSFWGKFNEGVQELEKVTKSNDEKEFVSLLKKFSNSYKSVLDSGVLVEESGRNGYKFDSDKINICYMELMEIHDFLNNNPSFTSKYASRMSNFIENPLSNVS